jgi:hypothetical protein
MTTLAVAVIGDIVGSRTYPDRARAQAAVQFAMSWVNDTVDHLEPMTATVGDEFQALYPDVESALRATLMLRLELPDPFDCRFGIGAGEVARIGGGTLQDGSAWWSARDAIVETKRRESSSNKSLRTWYLRASGDFANEDLTNAYLLCRDELLARLDGRGKRLLLGTVAGSTQTELAEREGISQSAVSQKLARSGVHAILASTELLMKG